MAAIQDLVLTFCPKMNCTPQRKLKLLMPVFNNVGNVRYNWIGVRAVKSDTVN